MLEKQQVDIIIVGRGGGSIEDLWAFNEEEVARAIFECEIPIISAVGHETDTTIADYVADLRAPTPSAATELAVFDYYQMEQSLRECQMRMKRALLSQLQVERLKWKQFETRLSYLHPKNVIREQQQRCVECEEKLRVLMGNRLNQEKHRFQICLEKMKMLSPLAKLSQGFSYVEKEKGGVVKCISDVKDGDRIAIYVTDGVIDASVEHVREEQHGK